MSNKEEYNLPGRPERTITSASQIRINGQQPAQLINKVRAKEDLGLTRDKIEKLIRQKLKQLN